MPADTLPRIWRPLMDAPSLRLDHCAICRRSAPLEQHHMVFRSQGEIFREGRRVPKPTITLCGFGNALSPGNGRPYCHGLAHHHLLHFRFDGQLEFLLTREPTRYADALVMDGWMPVPGI